MRRPRVCIAREVQMDARLPAYAFDRAGLRPLTAREAVLRLQAVVPTRRSKTATGSAALQIWRTEELLCRPAGRACEVDEDAQQMAAFLVQPGGGRKRGGGGVTKPASSGAGRPPFFRSRRLARLTAAF